MIDTFPVNQEDGGIYGALTISPPAFGPSDNSTCMFRSVDTGSQNC
jgi:hypothetical protein